MKIKQRRGPGKTGWSARGGGVLKFQMINSNVKFNNLFRILGIELNTITKVSVNINNFWKPVSLSMMMRRG